MANMYNNDKAPQHDSAEEGNMKRNLISFPKGRSSAILKQSSSSGLHMSHRNTVGRIPSHDQDKVKQIQTDTDKLKCQDYWTFDARLSSFKNWPVQIKQTPEQMARAGLFFTGFDDCVRCYVCGGKLRQWYPTDDPWIEHCRLFPLCSFAREQKGDHYITQIQETASSENQTTMNTGKIPVAAAVIIYLTRQPKSNKRNECNPLKEDEHFGYDIKSNLVEQTEGRMNLEAKRGAILEMGYDDLEFKKVVRHLRNMGIMKPTLEELVEALVELKE